jgi:hypothetical protein
MYWRDVVVHTNVNIFSNPRFKSEPPLPDRFQVGGDLWIGKIEPEACRIIFDLNEPSYHGTQKPIIQFAQLYSFVREVSGPANPYEWDKDGRLQNCVAISRLLVPTSVSFRYAGRIRYNTDGSVADISPADLRGVAVDTFLSAQPERDWLTEAEGGRLRALLARTDSRPLPSRANRALWYHEYAVRTYYVELRWVYVATALESLVHVSREFSGLQFRERVSQMAAELGVPNFGIGEAKQAYHLRSQLAHGQQLGGLAPADRQLYDSMEAVLRNALLRSIEDDDFADTLGDDQKIKKRWPICIWAT